MFKNHISCLYVENPRGKNKKIKKAEAQQLFKIEWLEWRPEDAHINESLKICYMGDKLGWGLFARKKINKNMIIGLFTGKIKFQSRDIPIESEHVFLNDAINNQFQIIDATNAGNITRFIQHLPTAETLAKISVNKSIKSQIALANVSKRVVKINNIFTEEYYTNSDIEADTILGCEYDPQFWLRHSPFLLTIKGFQVPINLYEYNNTDKEIKRHYQPKSTKITFFEQHISSRYTVICVFSLILAYYILTFAYSNSETVSNFKF